MHLEEYFLDLSCALKDFTCSLRSSPFFLAPCTCNFLQSCYRTERELLLVIVDEWMINSLGVLQIWLRLGISFHSIPYSRKDSTYRPWINHFSQTYQTLKIRCISLVCVERIGMRFLLMFLDFLIEAQGLIFLLDFVKLLEAFLSSC